MTIKYAVMSGDIIIRCLQLSIIDQIAAAKKIKHLYRDKACFLKAELITENLYKVYKEMGVKG